MRLSELRAKVRTEYLGNDKISGAEAKDLVKTVVGDGLTANGKKQLEKLRGEFADKFSAAGLRDFDKYFDRAVNDNPNAFAGNTPTPGSPSSPLGVRLGRNLDHLPTSFKLSEIQDRDVRAVLEKLDVNIDGKVDARDRDKMGFSDEQFKAFIFAATLMGKDIDTAPISPADLKDKKVCLTAVPDWGKAADWARAMGATVVPKVDGDLDMLIVGDAGRTGKDDRALILNHLGAADIQVGTYAAFAEAANEANVIGGGPDALPRAEYGRRIDAYMKDWYTEMCRGSWEGEIADASTPTERTAAENGLKTDLESWDDIDQGPDEYMDDMIDDQYEYDGPYKDRFGTPIPRDELDVISLSMYPEFAGIGLSKTFVFDRRTAELVDERDMQD